MHNLIVILKKTNETVTNEGRKNIVDSRYAKFRGNNLRVVNIFDMKNPKVHLLQAHSVYDSHFVYTIGEIVYCTNYNYNTDEICESGIHYFKDIRGAYYY